MLASSCTEVISRPARVHTTRSWVVHGPDTPGREAAQAFIRKVYARRYRAVPHAFAPVLVTLQEGDEVVAAAGYCVAGASKLFLEQYLDAPIEQVVAARVGEGIARSTIVEVGHLSAARAGAGWRLIRWLGPHLAAHGLQWVACTMTHETRRMFLRAGIAPIALGPADPRALGQEARQWGTYYQHEPVVVAGHLQQALPRLGRRLSRV